MLWPCLFLPYVAVATASIVSRSYQCGNQSYFTADNGIIRSHSGYDVGHDYGKNLDCVWTIEAPEGKFVQLVANAFHLEGSGCSYDYLQLFDGDSTNDNSLGKFCGNVFAPISSRQRFLTLNFVTDGSHGFRGFELFYNFTDHVMRTCLTGQFSCNNTNCVPGSYRCDGQDDCGDDSDEKNCQTGSTTHEFCAFGEFRCSNGNCISRQWICDGDNDCPDMSDETNCAVNVSRGCGQTNFTGTTGNISSPNFPLNYTSKLNCTYHVTAPVGTTSISFTFDRRFSIESSGIGTCTYDNVTISGMNGRNINGPFCGTIAPAPFEIHGDAADVRFITDSSAQRQGFMLTWSTEGLP
ncbi:cubilin-like isoform X2 [Dreissena polymorpha]|uniref:cubilin-like isoform X2 n=1 Tax=Dreissena polymorpha TaxID=45954 RepID=UPI0022644122|nr:cubilin-like isoform X2 [Dreissena polymorpha]